jgi:hypothetical protein
MTISIQNTAITNTFDFWRTQTNYLASAMSNIVVTVNSNTAVGNASITGTMVANLFTGNVSATLANIATVNTVTLGTTSFNANTANVMYINTNTVVVNTSIAVGTVSINTNYISIGNNSVNVQLTVPTSTQITNGQYYLASNSTWSPISTILPYSPTSNGLYITSGTGTQIIDFYPFSTFKTVEYTISVVDNLANNHYASKILTTHDGYNGYGTEYAQITTNTAIGTFFVDSNTSCVRLNYTPTPTLSATTVKFARINV